jgi:uncharacterized protein YtpQ (UPF0354 family)
MPRMYISRRNATVILAASAIPVLSRGADDVDTSAANLMVVLRETINANFPPDLQLKYIGKVSIKTNNGKEYAAELAHYAYLADTHIRFVFDGPTTMRNASAEDLERLGLTPQRALGLAIENIRRVYGNARQTFIGGGLRELDSRSPDLISSYFLDMPFWSALEREHPTGIVAVVPKRGGLLFTPVSNAQGVETLRKSVARMFTSSEHLRVSSAVFLFRGGKWSTLQAPVAKE